MPDTHRPPHGAATPGEAGRAPERRDTIGEIIGRRLNRRAALGGLFGVAAAAALAEGLAGPSPLRDAPGRARPGRRSHAVSADGRAAIYAGDEGGFGHVYKFVAARPWDPEEGTLHVARFHDDGRMEWLPLVFGQGPLTEAAGFRSQAEVLAGAPRAAGLLGATPMERPEAVTADPVNGHAYLVLAGGTGGTRPGPAAARGRVVEIIPPLTGQGEYGAAGRPKADHAATGGRWEVHPMAGDLPCPANGPPGYPGRWRGARLAGREGPGRPEAA